MNFIKGNIQNAIDADQWAIDGLLEERELREGFNLLNFNYEFIYHNKDLDKLCEELSLDLLKTTKIEIGRVRKPRVKVYLKAIISNLVYKRGEWVRYFRSSEKYSINCSMRYFGSPSGHSRQIFLECVEYLERCEFLEHVKPKQHSNPLKRGVSKIKGTNKLIKEETVFMDLVYSNENFPFHSCSIQSPMILRSKGKAIPFKISHLPMRKNEVDIKLVESVKKINDINLKHKILFNKIVKKEDVLRDCRIDINFRKNQYMRIFKDNFKSGGRFYGHWIQNIPEKYRRHLLIDGEPTVEIDYSCLHYSIFYAKKRLDVPKSDLYYLDGFNNHELNFRRLVKILSIIIINTKKKDSVWSAINYKVIQGKDYTCTDCPKMKKVYINKIIEAIEHKHSNIKDCFYTNMGLKIQYLDSCLANEVMMHFISQDKPIHCIHDSFIVKESDKVELEEVMKEKFKDMFGKDIEVKY